MKKSGQLQRLREETLRAPWQLQITARVCAVYIPIYVVARGVRVAYEIARDSSYFALVRARFKVYIFVRAIPQCARCRCQPKEGGENEIVFFRSYIVCPRANDTNPAVIRDRECV